MEAVLADADMELEPVHHGDGLASWVVNRRALRRGHGMRTGLEDTDALADGQNAADNAALVHPAMELIAELT